MVEEANAAGIRAVNLTPTPCRRASRGRRADPWARCWAALDRPLHTGRVGARLPSGDEIGRAIDLAEIRAGRDENDLVSPAESRVQASEGNVREWGCR